MHQPDHPGCSPLDCRHPPRLPHLCHQSCTGCGEGDDDLYIIGAVCMAVGHKFLYSSHFVDTFCVQ